MKLTEGQVRIYGVKNRFLTAEYPIYSFFIEDFSDAQKRIIDKIDHIESTVDFNSYPNIQDGNTGVKGTTLSHSMFNLFSDGKLDDLHLILTEACRCYAREVFAYEGQLFGKAWGNKLAQYKHMNRHHHTSDHDEQDYVHFSLHLTVDSCPENYTVYTAASNTMDNSLYVSNMNGQINIFPSTLPHHTTPNASDKPRYSLAMDIADHTREGQPQWTPLP